MGLPGGYRDRWEKLEDGAFREALEECGLTVELEGLVNVDSYRGRTPVVVVYAARAVAGTPYAIDLMSLEVGTFAPDTIPWALLAFESTSQALREYFNRHQRRSGVCRPPAPSSCDEGCTGCTRQAR